MPITSRHRAGLLAGAVALALALSGCGSDSDDSAGSGASDPAYDTSVRDRTAGWLTGQVDGGIVHDRQYDTDDFSLSTDIGIALATTGVEDDTVAQIADRVGERIGEYIEPGYGTKTAAGSTAKALVFEQLAGNDPTALGPDGATDLVATLEGTVIGRGPSAGRIADRLDPKSDEAVDYANVIGQSYAVWGLTEAGSDDAEAVTGFLLQQQCEDGWFRVTFTPDPTAKGQSCDASANPAADPDATAFAMMALSSIEDPPTEVSDSLDRAAAWLADQQAADGSFSSAAPAVPNSDTTGLAGKALAETGDTEAAAKAAGWVSGRVLGCDAGKDAGAIAYDDAALNQASQRGITVKTEAQFRLASAQALPVLSYLEPADAPASESQSC